MNRVFFSILTIIAAASTVALGTGAFFSDTERSTGNVFAAGVIDLTVDNESYYNGNKCSDVDGTEGEDWRWTGNAAFPIPGTPCVTSWYPNDLGEGRTFFNFTDLKPDDEGEDTISLHVDTNDAWACMNVSLTSDDDTSSTEPELGTGDPSDNPLDLWDGELADNIHFVWWADDGDNVLETGENILSEGVQSLTSLATTSGPFTVTLADSDENAWGETPGTPLSAGETYYVGKAWCLGTLTLEPVTAGQGVSPQVDGGVRCDGITLGNILQSDSARLDVSFFAHQARHDSAYQCPERERPPVACAIEEAYADEVVFVDQGLRKNSSAVIPGRSDTSKALGAPQSIGTPYDDTSVPAILNGFFSLGFPLGGNTAEIVLSFNDNVVVDAPGADLELWEVTGGPMYPDEQVDVFVGNTPVGPWQQVGFAVTRDAMIDISGVGVGSAWRYVRVKDASNLALFEATADGFDLDAVQALNCIVSPIDD